MENSNLTETIHNTASDASNITVAQWFYSAKCSYKNRPVCEISEKAAISSFTNHVAPYIGRKSLADVTASDCNAILRRLIEKNCSVGLLKAVYGVMTKIFCSAIAEGVLARSDYPCNELYAIFVAYSISVKAA